MPECVSWRGQKTAGYKGHLLARLQFRGYSRSLLLSKRRIGFHGVVGELGFPRTWRKFPGPAGRMCTDPLQHFDQLCASTMGDLS